ncbi:hypothetical protein Tco_0453449 [Tanacetum coccineum]
MYLTASRPDIMFDVCACARFQVTPKVSHLHAVKRIFRYLKGQPNWPLESKQEVVNFLVEDCFQAPIARSKPCCQLYFERKYVPVLASLLMDNTKHIEIRHHFIRDSNEKKLIQMIKIHTDHNVADLLTKAFDVGRFQYLIATANDEIQVSTVGLPYYCFLQDKESILFSRSNQNPRALSIKSQLTLPNSYTLINEHSPRTLIITQSLMANLEFCDKHNMVAYLKKPTGSEGFQEIVDFLNDNYIRYALTRNPTIYVSLIEKFWQTATVRTVDNGEQKINATIDSKEFTITKAFVRRYLQLADIDAEKEGLGQPSKPQPPPQTSEPIPNVPDEAVYEEWDDRVERLPQLC